MWHTNDHWQPWNSCSNFLFGVHFVFDRLIDKGNWTMLSLNMIRRHLRGGCSQRTAWLQVARVSEVALGYTTNRVWLNHKRCSHNIDPPPPPIHQVWAKWMVTRQAILFYCQPALKCVKRWTITHSCPFDTWFEPDLNVGHVTTVRRGVPRENDCHDVYTIKNLATS